MTAPAASCGRAGHRLRAVRRLLAAVLLAASLPAGAQERGAEPGGFDFYVLSLSWSPSYCMEEGADADPQQCGRGRPYGFIVHGLWPQYEKGYPTFCRGGGPDRVPQATVEAYLDLMPSAGLIGHQWRKHGSCSGLGQNAYFKLVREARQRVVLPEAFAHAEAAWMVRPGMIEESIIANNPGLRAEGVAVTCGRRHLREVRICLTRDLDFRPCAEVDRKSCRLDKALMPPARGG